MSAPSELPSSPYPGIRNYTTDDADWFFGRRKERELVISNLFNSRSRLIVYYGASGVGKTSLLLADVVPVLRGEKSPREVTPADRKRFDASVVVVFRGWQDRNFEQELREEIFQALLEKVNRVTKDGKSIDAAALRKRIAARLNDTPDAPALEGLDEKSDEEIWEFLYETAAFPEFVSACCKLAGRIFLIFDQFEEYFRYYANSREREQFDGDFATVVNSMEIPVTVLVSLREDGLSKLDRLQLRIPNLLENMLRLEHLDPEGAKEAITAPLERFNALRQASPNATGSSPIAFDADLIESLVHEVAPSNGGGDPTTPTGEAAAAGGLPPSRYRGASYLQILLASAWREVQHRGVTKLTVDGLKQAAHASIRKRGAGPVSSETMTFQTCAKQIAASYVSDIMEKELEGAVAMMDPADQERVSVLGIDKVRDIAARVLRYMITPGGAKMAHTVETLTRWANANLEEGLADVSVLEANDIDLTLRVLVEAGLLSLSEKGATAQASRYEVAHDVLGTPIDNWREAHESRRIAQRVAERVEEERRLREVRAEEEMQRVEAEKLASEARARTLAWWAAGLGFLLIVAIGLGVAAIFQKRKADLARRQAQALRSADAAYVLAARGAEPAITRLVALSSIPEPEDAKKFPAAPHGLIALRFSTTTALPEIASHPERVDQILSELDSYLPSLVSPNKKWLVTLEGPQVHVWNTEELYKSADSFDAVDKPVKLIGFTNNSRIFFVECMDGTVKKWIVDKRGRKQGDDVVEKEPPIVVKTLRYGSVPQPYPAFSLNAKKWIRDSLPAVRDLTPSEAQQITAGVRWRKVPQKELQTAFDMATKDRPKALKMFMAATRNLVDLDEASAGALLDLGTSLLLVRQGNEAAGKGELQEAEARYRDALQRNQNLSLDPKTEAEKWHRLARFSRAYGAGIAAKNENKSEEADQQFKKAQAIDPELWKIQQLGSAPEASPPSAQPPDAANRIPAP